MNVFIRDYQKDDEEEWLKCRALAYLGSNERGLERKKTRYDKSIELVALIDNKIIGFLEIELEKSLGSICYKKVEGNGMLWDLGVLPEFRRRGIATKLLDEGVTRGKLLGMKRLEAWSVEPVAWQFYEKYGFKQFFEYHHVLINNREKLRSFDKNGLHIIEIYAHVMSETDLKTIAEKHQPSDVLPCRGYELIF